MDVSPYSSNTLAGSGSQFRIFTDGAPRLGRIYYKATVGGRWPWVLLFSNQINGTVDYGQLSQANMALPPWEILSLRMGPARIADPSREEPALVPVTFGGCPRRTVACGEDLLTDPVTLDVDAGAYVCVEIDFRGRVLPIHLESLVPGWLSGPDGWTPSNEIPSPGLVGCARPGVTRVGYFGDSITQGCGTAPDSYTHWCAVLSRSFGPEFAFWNVGLGFGRASDAASNGAWMRRARQNDAVAVCFGVNDILRGASFDSLTADLTRTVELLHEAGCRVLIQTVPPFDYDEERRVLWARVNDFLRASRAGADALFDCVPVLSRSPEEPHRSRFGGHPDAEGCRVWAEALRPVMRDFLAAR
ncbi:MAG: SGNH/GDSL hydrolase family protein [Oscillospiraceae bacterium]|nr:SGNH/GDSL hydrolase family protein [Oscillospiraceae bacterium]